jgi:hydrogenase maturation protease
MPASITVLGLGNILLQDEGLGIRALERLTAQHGAVFADGQVQAVDGGVLGLDLLHFLTGSAAVLILDAVEMGLPPGTLVRLEGEEIPAALPLKMSMHQARLQELLALGRLQGTLPPRLVLWGMEPAAVDWGLELSPAVAAGLENLVTAAVGELRVWATHCPTSA